MMRVAISVLVCAFSTNVVAQSSQDALQKWIDLVHEIFTAHIALISVGVEQCGIWRPDTKDGLRAAYDAVRDKHLTLFSELEASRQYADQIALSAASFARQKEEDKDNYCVGLPRSIEKLAEQAAKMEMLPKR